MSYRGIDNSRNPMARPKVRGMFNTKHNCDQMPPTGRARFVTNMPLPGQQPPYPATVSFARPAPYPTIHSPDFQQVQYPAQVSATTVWNQSIPITMSETYQMPNQHSYPPQQQMYNADSAHIVAIQNNPYTGITQVQNQTEFDPTTNVCLCPKCGFLNTLAHIKLKQLSEENHRLREKLERQQNVNYEESVRSSPALQTTVSSLSADARPFHMGAAQGLKTVQESNVNAETTAEATSRLQNPNGNEYSNRPARNWQSHGGTPVVSASDVANDQFNESATSEPEWNNVSDSPHQDIVNNDTSAQQGADDPRVTEPPNVSANEEWDLSDSPQQDSNVVHSASGSFITSPDKQDDESTLDKKHTNSTPQGDGYGPPKDDRNPVETPKNRPREQRARQNRSKGSHDSNRDYETRKPLNRRGSGGYRPSSPPQEQREKKMEKPMTDSRDSSQSRLRSGSEYSDKKGMPSADSGAKGFDPTERSFGAEKRMDSNDRPFSHSRLDSGDRYGNRRGSANSKRFNDSVGRAKAQEESSNWRQDMNDTTRDEKRDFSRPGGKGGNSAPRRHTPTNFKMITEKEGDLFSAPDDFSLAHCVAEDLRMGSGIAVRFKQQFKNVEELCEQRKQVGQVAVLEDKNRFIFYLITKYRSNGKPTWGDFSGSVEELKRLCVEKGVKNLAMPRIGCGLDRLDWRNVKRLLETTFNDTCVSVTVFNFQQNEELESPSLKSKSTLFIMHERKNLADIVPDTGLLFLCAEEFTTMDRTIENLDKKHKILPDIRGAKRVVGDLVQITKGREYLYGLVVKKSEKDPFSYVNFGKCLRKLRNLNSKDQYGFFGMEAFQDERDPLTMEKIITSIRNVFGRIQYKLEFYICWPKEFENDHVWDDQNTPNTTPTFK